MHTIERDTHSSALPSEPVNDRPIGIFDSGIGGLTVAKAIAETLPCERFIYFGDTAHLPYGDKSVDAVKKYAHHITRFLVEKQCKAIVIACNTASAHAYEALRRQQPSIPIINVIDPTVDHCAAQQSSGKIGVIATKGTIQSGVYKQKILEKNSHLEVVSLATPLLVPMIEEGVFDPAILQAVLHNYLSDKVLKDIRTLILGCTHYPLIKSEVRAFFRAKVAVVDSADAVAQCTKKQLQKRGGLSTEKIRPHQFYVSDYTLAFENTSKLFFGEAIDLKAARIWEE